MPTLYHVRKDGQVVPVKMSIWDGFKGVPDRKPKPKPCDCCGKTHAPKDNEANTKNNAKKGDGNKNAGKKTGNDAGAGNKGGYSTSDTETYSPADDAKIVEMKENNQSWNDILKEIGKTSQSQLKSHYKFNLLPKVEKEKGKKEAEAKKTGKGEAGNDDESKQSGKKSKAEKKKEAEEYRAKHGVGKDDKAGGGKKDQGQGKKDGKSGGKKVASNDIKEWAAGYDNKKWLALASKHYDRTGQRISAEQAKKMALGN